MSGPLKVPKGWTIWRGEIGFSFEAGDIMCDVDRSLNPDTGLIEWRSRTWIGTGRADAPHVFHGQDLADAWLEPEEEVRYLREQSERDEALRDWTEHDRSAASSEQIDNVLREK